MNRRGPWKDRYESLKHVTTSGARPRRRGCTRRNLGIWPALLALSLPAFAQQGGLDPGFNPGAGPSAFVNVVAVQPDGRILLGGAFTSVDGVALNRIARLNPNGSVDLSFRPVTGANDDVRALVVQADGRIVLGGDFTTLSGAPRRRVARLLPDGQVDTAFSPPGGANNSVYDLALQTDGRVVLVGSFTEVAGTALNRIARLNQDGSVNTSFDPGTGANGVIRAVAVQTDGKIVIGGEFTSYNGLARNRIARLNPDGSLDSNFIPGTGANGAVHDVAVDGDGRVLIGGQFTQVAGTTQRYMARLTPAGAPDPFFSMAVGFNNAVSGIAVQPDGHVMAAGAFTSVNQIGRVRVARLNNDGSVDLTFDPGAGPNSSVLAVAAPQDGNVLISGQFTTVAGQTRRYVTRLSSDGGAAASNAPQIVVPPVEQIANAGLPASFTVVAHGNPPVLYQWTFNGTPVPGGTNSTLAWTSVGPDLAGDYAVTVSNTAGNATSVAVSLVVPPEAARAGSVDLSFNSAQGPNGAVYALAILPDRRLLIGGAFTTVDGQPRSRVARLLANGSVDPSFAPISGTSDDVLAIAVRADGQILLGGQFLTYNGAPRSRVARLLADGGLDTSFLPGLGANNQVDALTSQPDGKVVLGGMFTTVGGVARNYLARLNEDGSLDASFDPPGGANNRVRAIVLRSDGKLVVGGDFTRFAGTDRNRIARLNPDGTLDNTFVVGTGFNNAVYALSPLGSGILAGGAFTGYDGATVRSLALIEATGGLSPGLDTLVGFNNTVLAVGTDADGKILAGGSFTTVNNISRTRLVRLRRADGGVDTQFDTSAGANLGVYAIAAQPDRKVVIGGQFTSVAGETRRYVARLHTDPGAVPPDFNLAIRNTDDGVRVDLYGERGFAYSIQRSDDLVQWESWTNVAGAGLQTGVRILDPSSQTHPHAFYRGAFP